MHRVGGREPSSAGGYFGPYRVEIVKEVHGRRPMRLRMREEDSPGRTRVTVTGPVGESSCEIPLADPFPNEHRAHRRPPSTRHEAMVPAVEIALPSPIEIRRSGPFGFRIAEQATETVLAERRWGSTAIAGDLLPDIAAIVIAAVETPLTEAVSPFAWLRGL